MSLDLTIDMLKAAAEPTRFRLLALCARGQITVSELVEILGQSQPRISRHLKLLASAGLIERHRSGKYVYYRVPKNGESFRKARMILSLVVSNDSTLEKDLNGLMARPTDETPAQIQAERLFNRAILDVAATGAIGALLDIGVGSARIMKLLATHATRLVGIDNNRVARQHARESLKVAGLTNCSVLNGDMYQLPFDYNEFDTVIMDEVLYASDEPVFALTEAARTLTAKGRLIILEKIRLSDLSGVESKISDWLKQSQLSAVTMRPVNGGDVHWLIVIASKNTSN